MDEDKFLKLSCAWLAVALTAYIVIFLMFIPLVSGLIGLFTMNRW